MENNKKMAIFISRRDFFAAVNFYSQLISYRAIEFIAQCCIKECFLLKVLESTK